MDRFDSMRLLVRVVERQSFSAAASDLGLPRSSATTAIKQLEARLGVRLLQRTTRQVTPTLEGEIYYRRCKAILAEIEDAEAGLGGGEVRGLLRIDVHGPMARTFVLPSLPAFLARHPGLTLHIGEGDRFVDIVREGYDCVIRAGEIADSDLMVRRLGLAHEATFASPDYLARRGVPRTIDDLQGHEMIGFASSRNARVVISPSTGGGHVGPACISTKLPVPKVTLVIPGRKHAWPKRAACWSPAMALTGTPARGESGPRASPDTRPKRPQEGPTSGSTPGGMSNSAHSSSDHRRSTMS